VHWKFYNNFVKMSTTYDLNSVLDDQERIHSSCKIMQILRPITAEEEYIFDDGNMSCGSEISDPFSDLDDSKIFQYQKRKVNSDSPV